MCESVWIHSENPKWPTTRHGNVGFGVYLCCIYLCFERHSESCMLSTICI